MPTVQEILKQTGLTDEQIAAIDAKVVSGLTTVISTAEQAKEQGELALRAQREMYDKDIAPALNTWANEKAAYDAKMAAYDAALKSAKEGGFTVPPILDTPAQPPATRGPDGKFVPGANPVPGSPGFEQKLTQELGNAFAFAADTQWKYRTLYGKEMPDSPTVIIREASAQRMSPADYAAKKYDFAAKETALKTEAEKAKIDAAVKEAVAAKEKEWTEKTGSNPMVRQAEVSRFSTIAKQVKAGERKDTMLMGEQERRNYTRDQIHKQIAENDTVQ